jgi:putative phosphoribosyl transferase
LYREFALGALAEEGVVVLDEEAIGKDPILRGDLKDVIQEEQQRLKSYQARFPHPGMVGISSKAVLLVDDGLATGATTEAAVRSARKQGARIVTVTAPVGSTYAVERLQQVADRVEVMWVDPEFDAVGRYYESFPQTTDEEVLGLLIASATGRKC